MTLWSKLRYRAQNWRQKIRSDIEKKPKSEVSELILAENEHVVVDKEAKQWVRHSDDDMVILTLEDMFWFGVWQNNIK